MRYRCWYDFTGSDTHFAPDAATVWVNCSNLLVKTGDARLTVQFETTKKDNQGIFGNFHSNSETFPPQYWCVFFRGVLDSDNVCVAC